MRNGWNTLKVYRLKQVIYMTIKRIRRMSTQPESHYLNNICILYFPFFTIDRPQLRSHIFIQKPLGNVSPYTMPKLNGLAILFIFLFKFSTALTCHIVIHKRESLAIFSYDRWVSFAVTTAIEYAMITTTHLIYP